MKPEIMAESPRCKRRKQSNPRRKTVLTYDSVLETPSETDEDDSFTVGRGGVDKKAGSPSGVPVLEASPRVGYTPLSIQENPDEHQVDHRPESHLDSISDLNDYFLKRNAEDGDGHMATIAEFLQRGDTTIIYPEAPEDTTRLSIPKVTGQDESEHDPPPSTADDFAELLTCPYCERGYKRLASLKEHIKYRHEKMVESFSCPLCSDSFTQRPQLERHMTSHRSTTDQAPMLSEGATNRKFKCSECGKAFKYKHHLKEHLRIHSGEKPYECSNCKKRFSHSGSYSSHISSKKCIGLIALNGRIQNGNNGKPGSSPNSTTSSPLSPVLSHFQQKLENGQLLCSQDQQGRLNIKAEQMDFNEYQLLMASHHGFGGPGVYLNGHSRSPLGIHSSSQSSLHHLGGIGLDLSLLDYTVPLGNSLSDMQKVLQIVDNTVCKQRMDGNPDEISKLRAYMKELGAQIETQVGFHVMGQSNPTKSIIEYTLEKVNEAKNLINELDATKEKSNTSVDILNEEESPDAQNLFLPFSCQYCRETFPGPIPLHQHERYLCRMNEEIKAVLQPAETSPASYREPMTEELSCSEKAASPTDPFKNHGSLLNAYFAMNTEPNSEELLRISLTVGLPQEVVKKLFVKWKNQNHGMDSLRKQLTLPEHSGLDHSLSHSPVSLFAMNLHDSFINNDATHRLTKVNQCTPNEQTTGDKLLGLLDHSRNNSPSPLNLSSISSKHSQSNSYTPNSLNSEDIHRDIPLDLSLPKHLVQRRLKPNGFVTEHNGDVSECEQGSRPLDLVNIKKEVLGSDYGGNSIHQLDKTPSPIFGINPFTSVPVYTALPPQGAFPTPSFISPSQATMSDLRPYSGTDTMSFLPNMAYTCATGATKFAGFQQWRKYQQKAGFQEELLDGTEDYVSSLDEVRDGDPLLSRRTKRMDSGMYACDLCDKTFQKTSSLLRHKYEHTGKRPHQCQICKKAFKHKHHLIEHSRLHSGEKPYQCDKCGKRFSHSGSYSQHMNHRYSYCKREAEEREAAQRKARDKGGLETTELLLKGAFLQGLGPLIYSDPENQLEDGTIIKDSTDGGGAQVGKEVKEMVTDQKEACFRKTDRKEEKRDSTNHAMMDQQDKDSMQLMDQPPPEENSRLDQED